MEIGLLYGVGAVTGGFALYKLVKPHFKVSVNCHFCNENFKVNTS